MNGRKRKALRNRPAKRGSRASPELLLELRELMRDLNVGVIQAMMDTLERDKKSIGTLSNIADRLNRIDIGLLRLVVAIGKLQDRIELRFQRSNN